MVALAVYLRVWDAFVASRASARVFPDPGKHNASGHVASRMRLQKVSEAVVGQRVARGADLGTACDSHRAGEGSVEETNQRGCLRPAPGCRLAGTHAGRRSIAARAAFISFPNQHFYPATATWTPPLIWTDDHFSFHDCIPTTILVASRSSNSLTQPCTIFTLFYCEPEAR